MFEVIDQSGREIRISKERLSHILKHPEMTNMIPDILMTLRTPLKITDYSVDA